MTNEPTAKQTRVKAYAVVDSRGRLAVHDGRLPLYWRKRVAREHMGIGEYIVRVEVTYER